MKPHNTTPQSSAAAQHPLNQPPPQHNPPQQKTHLTPHHNPVLQSSTPSIPFFSNPQNNLPVANTYSQIYIQAVFVVKHRRNLINKEDRIVIHRMIDRIIKNRGQKMLAVYAMPDHVHVLLSIGPDVKMSDIMRDIKTVTNNYMNANRQKSNHFCWQRGYACFSYSKSAIRNVCNYIEKQEEIHRKRSFKKEYLAMLKKHGIKYDTKYLFEFYHTHGHLPITSQ